MIATLSKIIRTIPTNRLPFNFVKRYFVRNSVGFFKNPSNFRFNLKYPNNVIWSSSAYPDVLTRHLLFEGYYQLDVLYFINNFIKPNSTFLDIGGHHGLMSIVAAKKDSSVKVYTFEPNPNALKHLYRNIEINQLKNIEVIELPVYDKKENVKFYIHQGNVSWNSTIVKEFAYSDIPKGNTIIEIDKETIVLDEFAAERNLNVDLIKIDVEGAEINVLKGGLETLKVHKPAIIMEFNPLSIESAKLTIKELIDIFDDLNYKIIILKRNLFGYYNIKNHTVFNPKKHCKNGKIANVICIEKSKLESLVK